jgi:Mrp family chromosome partitioning ATPase
MGRTFEVLGGRTRKATGGDAPAAIPFPTTEPDAPAPAPEVVPLTADDLPGDNNSVPFVEVGGPRPKTASGPELRAPKFVPQRPAPEVAFQLLHGEPQRPPSPGSDLIAYHRPDHPAARQYRMLADGIAAQYPAGRSPVLVFTAIGSRPLSTSAVANLAVTRASDGFGRVLVIEADKSPGSSSDRFGIPPVPGLRELLTRSVPLTMALHRTGVDGVYVMPAGKTTVGTDEAGRLPALLDILRARFDWLLVDAPSWGMHSLGEWLRASDGVYLVLRPDEWDSPQADAAHDGIARGGGRLRGCVITQDGNELSPAKESANDDRSRNQVIDHVSSPVGVAGRRLSGPRVVRRPGDD